MRYSNFKEWWLSDESPRRHMSETGAYFVMDHCREAWNAGLKSKLPAHTFGENCERCGGNCTKNPPQRGMRSPRETLTPFEL